MFLRAGFRSHLEALVAHGPPLRTLQHMRLALPSPVPPSAAPHNLPPAVQPAADPPRQQAPESPQRQEQQPVQWWQQQQLQQPQPPARPPAVPAERSPPSPTVLSRGAGARGVRGHPVVRPARVRARARVRERGGSGVRLTPPAVTYTVGDYNIELQELISR